MFKEDIEDEDIKSDGFSEEIETEKSSVDTQTGEWEGE